jgi:hypothetical protein
VSALRLSTSSPTGQPRWYGGVDQIVTGRLDMITHVYIMGDDDERIFAARSDLPRDPQVGTRARYFVVAATGRHVYRKAVVGELRD